MEPAIAKGLPKKAHIWVKLVQAGSFKPSGGRYTTLVRRRPQIYSREVILEARITSLEATLGHHFRPLFLTGAEHVRSSPIKLRAKMVEA